LASDSLEEPKVWSTAIIRSVFLSDSRPVVCRSRGSQKCASQHGLFRFSVRAALDVRNAAARALPELDVGSATVETRVAMGMLALDNIDSVLAGIPAPTLIAQCETLMRG